VSSLSFRVFFANISAFASNRYSLASTNETYQSGALGAVDANPFRQSQSFASMTPYTTDPSSLSQLAAPRGYHREQSPNSSAESGSRGLDRMPSDDPSTNTSYPSHLYSPDAGAYQDEDSAPILQASPEPAYIPPGQYSQPTQGMYDNEPRRQPSHGRGVSLVDTGPVAHEPVRRVSKHQRRSSSRQYLASPISTSTHASSLPPGAVCPSPLNSLPR
jgi:chitin synthase